MSEVDASGLIASLRRVRAAGRELTPQWLDKTAKDIAIKAIGYTPKTPASQIRAELTDAVCAAILKRGVSLPKRLSGFAGGKHSKAEWAQAIKTLRAARASSSGARKAGWVKAAQDLGGRQASRVSKAGFPGKSEARKASPRNLATLIVNRAKGAYTGGEGLQRAIDVVAKDKNAFAEKLMAKMMAKHSAR